MIVTPFRRQVQLALRGGLIVFSLVSYLLLLGWALLSAFNKTPDDEE